MHVLHKWGKWEDYVGTFESPLFRQEWTEPIQLRTCEKCGKRKIKRF